MKTFTPIQIIARLGKMRPARAQHENIWQQVGELILPLQRDIQESSSPGTPKYEKILDNTGPMSNEMLSGSLHTWLTNPAGYFFGLSTGDPTLDAQDEVAAWIQNEVRDMHDDLNNSNFQTEVHEMYQLLVGTGNGPMMMEEDDDTVVRFSTRPLKETFVKENSRGFVDEFMRTYKLDARGICDDFGEKNLPKRVSDAYEKGDATKFEIIHAVYPVKAVPGYDQSSRFKYISQYVLVDSKANLEIEGFYELPGLFPRWTKVPGEDYGRGCGEKALPEVRMVNLMQEITIKGAQKTIDPPLQAPDNGFVMPLITRPAGMNYYRAGSTDRIEPIFNDARIDFGFQSIQASQTRIREAYYVDQLKLPSNGPMMTATETSERTEQGMRVMSPMLGRLQSEFLKPLVERLYAIRERRGLVKLAPQQLKDKKLRVMFTSVLAMTQRQSELTSIGRFMGAIAPFASADPAILGMLNSKRSLDRIAQLTNFPVEMKKTAKELDAQAQAEADQKAAMQKQAEDQNQADAASKLMTATSKLGQAGNPPV